MKATPKRLRQQSYKLMTSNILDLISCWISSLVFVKRSLQGSRLYVTSVSQMRSSFCAIVVGPCHIAHEHLVHIRTAKKLIGDFIKTGKRFFIRVHLQKNGTPCGLLPTSMELMTSLLESITETELSNLFTTYVLLLPGL